MKCFVDLDGVLVDFQRKVCGIFSLPYPPEKYEFFKPIRDSVNAVCNEEFWESLDWMIDGKEILQKIESFFSKEIIYFLSVPMPNPGSWTGKFNWMKKNLPQYADKLIVTRSKVEILSSNNILIDDNEDFCTRFALAGGTIVLVPRPWNGFRDQPVIPSITKQMMKIKKGVNDVKANRCISKRLF